MRARVLIVCGLASGLLIGAALPSPAATLTVTNVNDSGPGSLRQAILDSNSTAGVDQIDFLIPGAGLHTIHLASPLPDITDQVVLDARTQPGWTSSPVVEVNGAALAAPNAVMTVSAGSSIIRGLAFTQGADAGVRIQTNPGIQIEYCGIGAIDEKSVGLGNAGPGVDVVSGLMHSISRNRIASNGAAGILVRTAASQVQMLQNMIYSNGGLPIDLGGDGRTANDPGDVDVGANNLQNYPVLDPKQVFIDGATAGSREIAIQGTLDSEPSTVYRVYAVFGKPGATPDDFQILFPDMPQITIIKTDPTGHTIIAGSASFPEGATAVAVCAIDPLGNMSEFSPPVEIHDVVLTYGCGACGLEWLMIPVLLRVIRRRRRATSAP